MCAGKSSCTRGFTLIELLVTIAVVVILATVAAPSFQGVVRDSRFATAYNEANMALHYARNEAMAKRRDVAFDLVDNEEGGGKLVVKQGGATLMERKLDGRMVASLVADNEDGVVFNPLGRSPGCVPSCEINVSDGSKDASILIDMSGRIRRKEG